MVPPLASMTLRTAWGRHSGSVGNHLLTSSASLASLRSTPSCTSMHLVQEPTKTWRRVSTGWADRLLQSLLRDTEQLIGTKINFNYLRIEGDVDSCKEMYMSVCTVFIEHADVKLKNSLYFQSSKPNIRTRSLRTSALLCLLSLFFANFYLDY